MALRNTPGTIAVPRLVVKIIGSKQVKYFITEEPDKEKGAAIPLDVVDNVMKEPPDKQDSIVARSHRQAEAEGGVGSALQAALNKAPTRLCVTAPSGDRSLSYIHQRNPAVTRTELRAGTAAKASEEEEKVHCKDLLQFLRGVVLPEELQDDIKAESGHVSHTSGVPRGCSEPPPASVDPMETERWLQRFQRMERAMHMCDTKNTGYIDQDKARRLIQNYNHIFNLNLSPLRISEVTHGHGGRRQGKVHLDTALQYLKEL